MWGKPCNTCTLLARQPSTLLFCSPVGAPPSLNLIPVVKKRDTARGASVKEETFKGNPLLLLAARVAETQNPIVCPLHHQRPPREIFFLTPTQT